MKHLNENILLLTLTQKIFLKYLSKVTTKQVFKKILLTSKTMKNENFKHIFSLNFDFAFKK